VDDARAGRCYVPAAMLHDAGIERIDPEDRSQRKDLARVAVRLLEEAEVYYRSAYAGLSELPPRSAWAIAAALRVYRAIGKEVRRRGPDAWDGRRAGTGKAEKLALVALATTDVAATRFRRPGRGRHGLFNRGAVPAPDEGAARPCSA
jgi:phytoene synthase